MSGDDALSLDAILSNSRKQLEERFGTAGYDQLKDAVAKKAGHLHRRNARRLATEARLRERAERERAAEDDLSSQP